MTKKIAWKTLSAESQLSLESPVLHARRFCFDTGREYVGDGTQWLNVNFTHRGEWDSGTAYKRQDIVIDAPDGDAWIAKRANIGVTPTEGADWTFGGVGGPQGPQGDQGDQGPVGPSGGGVTVRGAWNSATAYTIHDAVTYDGSFWRALRSNTNVPPVEGLDWTVLAAKGATGSTGATGAAGSTGPAGPAGSGVPAGGTTGQFLVKNSNTDGDAGWFNRGKTSVSSFEGGSVDIASGMALTANTWADILFDMNFTLLATNSVVSIFVGGFILCATAGTSTTGIDRIAAGIRIDNATRYVISGDNLRGTVPGGNFLSGSGPLVFTNMTAGVHQLDLQLISSVAATARCRPLTQPNFEDLRIIVTERVD